MSCADVCHSVVHRHNSAQHTSGHTYMYVVRIRIIHLRHVCCALLCLCATQDKNEFRKTTVVVLRNALLSGVAFVWLVWLLCGICLVCLASLESRYTPHTPCVCGTPHTPHVWHSMCVARHMCVALCHTQKMALYMCVALCVALHMCVALCHL